MFLRPFFLYLILTPTLVIASGMPPAGALSSDDEPEYAPIVERDMDFFDFTLKTTGGQEFNLRRYAADKQIVIVGFVAGWCKNSNNNGHVIKRLYDKYKDRGLGLVAVMEYSTSDEIEIHSNRIGIDYPVVIETESRGKRKKSAHYKYRKKAGDNRKWGTPFYVIIETDKIEPAQGKDLIARHVYTVAGEIIESEAEQFIEQRLRDK